MIHLPLLNQAALCGGRNAELRALAHCMPSDRKADIGGSKTVELVSWLANRNGCEPDTVHIETFERIRLLKGLRETWGRDAPDGPTDSMAIIEQAVNARAEFRILQNEQYRSDSERLEELLDPSVRQQREETLRQDVREEVLHELDCRTAED